MKRFLSLFNLVLVIVFFVVWIAAPAAGYGNNASGDAIEGGAHRSINRIAGALFIKNMKSSTEKSFANIDFEPLKDPDKYKVLALNEQVEEAALKALFQPTGLAITGKSDDRDAEYEATLKDVPHKFSGWVIEGGFSADEPESFMSMRHFFNPISSKGKAWLTDLPWVTGRYMGANPEIDAITWAMSHNDNDYNWTRGQEELMDGFSAGTAAEAAYFYAHAWRSLGECMHLLADMTVPAHVRNDSHPGYWYAAGAYDDLRSDVYEYFMNWPKKIEDAWSGRIMDPAVLATIQSANDVPKLYADIATYVNTRFFSADTIPYKNWRGAETSLNNGFGGIVYDSPKLDGMTHDEKGYYHASDAMGGDMIMAHDSWLDDDGWDEYPKSFNLDCAKSQALRLVPIAVHANARLMALYMPKVTVAVTGAETDEDSESEEPVIRGEILVHPVDGKGGYVKDPDPKAMQKTEQTLLLFAKLTDAKGKSKEVVYLAPPAAIDGGEFEISLEDLTEEGGLYDALHPAKDAKAEDVPTVEYAVGLDMGGVLVRSDWYGGEDITGLWNLETTYESVDIPDALMDTSGMEEAEAKVFRDSMRMAYGGSMVGQTFRSQIEIVKKGAGYVMKQPMDAQTAAQMNAAGVSLDYDLTLKGDQVICTYEQKYEGGGQKGRIEASLSGNRKQMDGSFTMELTFMVEGVGNVVWSGSWRAEKVE